MCDFSLLLVQMKMYYHILQVFTFLQLLQTQLLRKFNYFWSNKFKEKFPWRKLPTNYTTETPWIKFSLFQIHS